MQAIIANGEPKEIAALVLAMQERQTAVGVLNIDGKELSKVIIHHLESRG